MGGEQNVNESNSPASPVKNKVGSIFIPVRDMEKSRSWYCRLLGSLLVESNVGAVLDHIRLTHRPAITIRIVSASNK